MLRLRQNNHKAYLGELGASNSATCQTKIDDTLNSLEANADVWVGWAWWEAGAYNSGNFN
jgi:endoglucanase